MVSRINHIGFVRTGATTDQKLVIEWWQYGPGFSNPPSSLVIPDKDAGYLAVDLPRDLVTTSFYNTYGQTMIWEEITTSPSVSIEINDSKIEGIYLVNRFSRLAGYISTIRIDEYTYDKFRASNQVQLTPCTYKLVDKAFRIEVTCPDGVDRYNFLLLPTEMYHVDNKGRFPAYQDELSCWYVIDLRTWWMGETHNGETHRSEELDEYGETRY
jgi:hypothetical protein